MRKIIVIEFVTLDGVMQAPGGSKEDVAEGFQYGGWSTPYFDEMAGKEMQKQMEPADYLFGRKTFQIFESYWPKHAEGWPGVMQGTKYVLSETVTKTDWEKTMFMKSVDDIKKLKESNGPDLQVWGSSKLAQLLFKNDLVDEMWLKIFPITLGTGKKLFAEGTIPAAFKLVESKVSPSGVIFANYKRDGEVKTGEVQD